ncbi:MAG: hypothetical protein KBT31_05920 [Firmicutes bacterium]|nr:hypothetical protein [Candidatus Colimorpha enterica]
MTFRFRESFRGYNKDDVNSYIEQLSQKYSKKEAELTEKLKNVGDNTEMDGQIVLKDDEIARLSAENEYLRKTVDELKAELTGLKNCSAGKEQDGNDGEDVAMAEDKAAEILSDAETKSEMIIRMAETNAEKVIADAKEKYNAIIDEAEERKAETIKSAEAEKETKLAELDRQYGVMSRNYAAECSQLLDGISAKFDLINSRLQSDAEALLKEAADKLR